jgi:hypothetical protein
MKMTGSKHQAGNPFVGPRPFEPGERLWGRDREISALRQLLNAERIVLLHSPSGAGKSSLVQAGLLPRLERSFDIWGPTRLGLEPPRGAEAEAAGANRYLLSAVQGFEEAVPQRLRRSLPVLAAQTLREYVEQRPRRRSAAANTLLIFDQFEEVLTADPLAVKAKQEFFAQVGEVLRDSRVWALFVLREDFLAPLDPYARLVPTHLKKRFRIDLLGLDGARQAMVEPAREGGREFPAATQLVQDLATMKVQQADGSFVEQTGQHVEPVQLQVVCRRLWAAMPADATSIDDAHLQRFGNVNEALAGYYGDAVRRIGGSELPHERAIREWFSYQLITSSDTRGQVLKEAETSAGLDNRVIERLLDTHLVRAEQRAGSSWYELAHDRLISPVQNGNRAWLQEHLAEVQQIASLWERQGRPAGLLLSGEELTEARTWAAEHELTATERDFLAESERAAVRRRRLRQLAVAVMIVAAIAVVAGAIAAMMWGKANQQAQVAEEQRNQAEQHSQEAGRQRDRAEQEKQEADLARIREEEQRLLAEQQRRLAERNERLARARKRTAEAARVEAEQAQDHAETARQEAEQARDHADQSRQVAEVEKLRADESAATSERLRLQTVARELALTSQRLPEDSDPELAALLAFHAYRLNRDHGGLADDPDIYSGLWQASKGLSADGTGAQDRFPSQVRAITLLAGGRLFAAGGEDAAVHLVDLARAGPHRQLAPAGPVTLEGRIRSLAATSYGRIAAGTIGGSILIWESQLAPAPRTLTGNGHSVYALAFRPGLASLAAGTAGGVWLWNLNGGKGRQLPGAGAAYGLAFHPDGRVLAAAGESGLCLWDLEAIGHTPRRLGGALELRSLVFSDDGELLAAGGVNGSILVWDRSAGEDAEPITLTGHTAAVTALAFNPREAQLASASLDGTVRLWPFQRSEQMPIVLTDHDAWVWSLAYVDGGKVLLSAGSDRAVRRFTTCADLLAEEICPRIHRNLSTEEWWQYLPPDLGYECTCPELPPGSGAPTP